MKNKKLKVGILFGGKSVEHEVSLQTAKKVIEALDPEKYEAIPIGIDKDGRWLAATDARFLLGNTQSDSLRLDKKSTKEIALVPESEGRLMDIGSKNNNLSVDVVFPVLHGQHGEDGTIQGLLKLAGVPFVGAGVLGSAVGMDKDVMKRLLRDAKIPVAKFQTYTDIREVKFEIVKKTLGLPFFIKPANTGSSVGVHKVKNTADFKKAIIDAFNYDSKIIIEEYINGREIECGVIGNHDPIASRVGEIITTHEFYSYEAKYLDEDGARIEIPAKISSAVEKKIQAMAIKTFKILGCEGMGRVDFFVTKKNKIYVNEINTIPGPVMFRRLWEASGIAYPRLVDALVMFAIERFKREQKIKTKL